MRCTLPVLVLLLVAGPALAQRKATEPPVRIYVGPFVKDGIVEIDRGIEDSIGDIKKDLRFKKREFTITETPEEAQISLIVLGRGAGRGQGAVAAAPMPNLAIAVPIEGVAVEALLRMGAYERRLRCEDDQWGDCAEDLVEDVRSWIKANRGLLKK